MSAEVLSKNFEDSLNSMKKIQKDLSKANSLRTQLDSQLNENKSVKEELDLLESDAVVYKLLGPALIKQEVDEAKQNVNKRIDYITQELKRHEGALEKLSKEEESKRESLTKIQEQLLQAMNKKQ